MTWRRVLSDKRHLIWPLAVALIGNAALLVLVVYPLSRKVAGGEQQAETVAAELDAARRDYAAARATVSGKQAADKALQQFYSAVLPPDLSGARRIFTKVDPLLRTANLRRTQATQRETIVRDSQLGKLTMIVDFSGSYPEIRRFLHALETSPEFVVIENVELLQEEGEGRTGINVTVQIATYYRGQNGAGAGNAD